MIRPYFLSLLILLPTSVGAFDDMMMSLHQSMQHVHHQLDRLTHQAQRTVNMVSPVVKLERSDEQLILTCPAPSLDLNRDIEAHVAQGTLNIVIRRRDGIYMVKASPRGVSYEVQLRGEHQQSHVQFHETSARALALEETHIVYDGSSVAITIPYEVARPIPVQRIVPRMVDVSLPGAQEMCPNPALAAAHEKKSIPPCSFTEHPVDDKDFEIPPLK